MANTDPSDSLPSGQAPTISAIQSLQSLAECFLSFGIDPSENIAKLTRFCGECLKADYAMYDRMDGVKLTRLAIWNPHVEKDILEVAQKKPGYDSIRMLPGDIFEIRHVEKVPVAKGAQHRLLHTLFGRVVKDHDQPIGALSVFFQNERILLDAEREILGIVASAVVIEDRRLKAEQLVVDQQTKMVASAKMTVLGEMAAGVAHEINNPLMAILMRIEQLRDLVADPQNAEESQKVLNVLENLTMRIAKIVKSLRSFSGDSADGPFAETTVGEIIDSVIDFCKERFKQHRIELRINPLNCQLKLHCRTTQVGRAILNLLHNASDAVQGSEKKWVEVKVDDAGDFVEISVVDSGPGVSADIKEKIFQPFFSTKDVNRGQGLGLSVARGIIEKHSGTLVLDQNSGVTRFTIRIPKQQKWSG